MARGRRPRVYRRLVEQRIGRALLSREVVHHIDGNFCNDDPDNLLALSSQAAHMRIHMHAVRERQGFVNLFPLEEVLASCLDTIVWVSEAGAIKVFGDEAGQIIAAEVSRRYSRKSMPVHRVSKRRVGRKDSAISVNP